jgi:hypothetical protein
MKDECGMMNDEWEERLQAVGYRLKAKGGGQKERRVKNAE